MDFTFQDFRSCKQVCLQAHVHGTAPSLGYSSKVLCHHIYSGPEDRSDHDDKPTPIVFLAKRKIKCCGPLSEAYYTGDINPICWIASRDSAEGLKDPANLVEVLHRAREELVVSKAEKSRRKKRKQNKRNVPANMRKRQQPELLKNDVNTLTVTKLEQQLLKKDDVLTASEKQQLLKIRESRKKRISKEPGNDDYFKIIIQHPGSSGRPAVGRRFKKDALYQEVYDWAGSEESLPLHFVLKRNGMEVVRHSDPIQGHGVLDLCERTEDQIRSLLGCQVSFKGTYMCATDEELHSTVVGEKNFNMRLTLH
ncbi:hypothetical protein OS493_012108 [Desmophyllum pertusum]|uniref:Uncharacterized protein n=1 Tax=Desmophyllum pertusum TaxID=174260 RepID=A0A9X0DBY6_9CNID|nr:hypothetical protein OS493_012108 [Desmophyllum pertusum]